MEPKAADPKPHELHCCDREFVLVTTGVLVHAFCVDCERYLSTYVSLHNFAKARRAA